MLSLKELYKIGVGPSSSHTMGPQTIAKIIKEEFPQATHFHVDLHGSLALTGKGHLTDHIIEKTLSPKPCTFSFKADALPYHPNGMIVHVYHGEECIKKVEVYSIGGGDVYFKGDMEKVHKHVYPHKNMQEILSYCDEKGISLYDYVIEFDEEDIQDYLIKVLETMFECVQSGLHKSGVLQGKLQIKRVAKDMYNQALNTHNPMQRGRLFVSSYAYAVAEENADGDTSVTAPTCGASGVVPAVLYYAYKELNMSKKDLVKALAIGGLFGNSVKMNATVSGADGGCQAEVGTACAMASAMMAWIMELNNELIDYAAEMGLEHNLGLTCDPVGGYVQIPCIERNAFAAMRAVDAAMLASQLGYVRKNKISFDAVVRVMKETGSDLNVAYKETSLGGLAKEMNIHAD